MTFAALAGGLGLAAIAVLTVATVCSGAEIPDVLRAIHQVEASGRLHPPDGDDGKAIGPMQIWRDYWTDSRVPGKYQQCRDLAYAERVVRAYWKRYCPKALASGDARRLAVIHHLGPHPERAPKEAERYWNKVKAAMKGEK
ncbi:MAG TPA: hypothetical protein VMZ06_08420 [Candidatus Bathyarchaeia archaeon]|nr:hypothetical protein [Phycisphaerae bacterium]HUW61016.1 hypothetical protein [Candidatus Bathyarchaeia archaeon]HUW99422.1 hypothetical protein [Phycisphaerae bacterium]